MFKVGHMKALEVARDNPVTDLPAMGAALFKRKKLIATGMNSQQTHPLQAKFGKNEHAIQKHAEIDCIINALRVISVDELKDCTMYVARVLKNGQPALAKPCCGCQRAIENFEIKDIFWTVDVD